MAVFQFLGGMSLMSTIVGLFISIFYPCLVYVPIISVAIFITCCFFLDE